MAKTVKNNKVTEDTWVGMTLQPDEVYTVQPVEEDRWARDSKVETDILSEDLIVSDDLGELEAEEGLSLIKHDTRIKTSLTFPINANISLGSLSLIGNRITFRGSSFLGTPYKIKVILRNSSMSPDIRIYDITNSNVICSKNDITISNSSLQVVDLGVISNISVREALWEVQGARNGLLGTVTIESVIVYF